MESYKYNTPEEFMAAYTSGELVDPKSELHPDVLDFAISHGWDIEKMKNTLYRSIDRERQSRIRPKGEMGMENIQINKNQLLETIKRTVTIYHKRKYAKSVMRDIIYEQALCSARAHYLLTEGPMDSVWSGIKGAIQGAGADRRGTKDSAFAGAMKGYAGGKSHSKAQNALAKSMKAVATAKHKFNSQMLKSVEILNQYHEAVLKAMQVYQKVSPVLGPMAEKMGQEINQMVGQLQYDLESEKEQIENFIAGLKQNAPHAQKASDEARKAGRQGPEMGPGATQVTQPGEEGYAAVSGRRGGTGQAQGALAQRVPTMGEFEQMLQTKGTDPSKIDPKLKQAAFQKFKNKLGS